MLVDYKPTHDPNQDTFKVEYLLGGAAIMGLVLPPKYNITEVRICIGLGGKETQQRVGDGG